MNSPAIGVGLMAAAVTIAGAAALAAPVTLDEEVRRVELVARVERSVVLVLVEGREISHEKETVSLEPSKSLGTGFLVSSDGLILTAAHVVRDADRVRAQLEKGDPVPVRVVFSDETSDVALLRLETVPDFPLAPARLGDSDRVRKGETVYVIGNPMGIEKSVSVGVVSGRRPMRKVFGGLVETEVIQTDAAINQGNSGGPIFNSRGEVIAMAQAILTRGGGSEGLGFGLTINAVRKILESDPCRWLGFSGAPLDEGWSRALNVPSSGGVLVMRVTPGGPADQAGLEGGSIPIQFGKEHALLGGDVILALDGVPVEEWMRTRQDLAMKPGERREVRLTVLRGGRTRELTLVAIHRPGW